MEMAFPLRPCRCSTCRRRATLRTLLGKVLGEGGIGIHGKGKGEGLRDAYRLWLILRQFNIQSFAAFLCRGLGRASALKSALKRLTQSTMGISG